MVNLLFTVSWLKEQTRAIFDPEEITPQQFNILRILRGSHPKPLSTQAIRDRMLEKMSDTSRIVDRLIVKGLVKKVTCESDRRLVDVQITDKGRKLLERIDLKENEMDVEPANIGRIASFYYIKYQTIEIFAKSLLVEGVKMKQLLEILS